MPVKNKTPLVCPGACISVRLSGKRFAGCRVTGLHRDAPILEIVHWIGNEPPTADAIRRAKRAVLMKGAAGFERGPLRFVLMDAPVRLPAGFAVVAVDPRVARKGAVPHLGMWWPDIKKALVVAAANASRVDAATAVKRDEAREAAALARRAGLTPKVWRLREEAREVCAMWRAGEYDNLKDVVYDLASLLPKVRGAIPGEAASLDRVKRAVLRELVQLANEPGGAADARAWTRKLRAV
jgi:hypothetical protein